MPKIVLKSFILSITIIFSNGLFAQRVDELPYDQEKLTVNIYYGEKNDGFRESFFGEPGNGSINWSVEFVQSFKIEASISDTFLIRKNSFPKDLESISVIYYFLKKGKVKDKKVNKERIEEITLGDSDFYSINLTNHSDAIFFTIEYFYTISNLDLDFYFTLNPTSKQDKTILFELNIPEFFQERMMFSDGINNFSNTESVNMTRVKKLLLFERSVDTRTTKVDFNFYVKKKKFIANTSSAETLMINLPKLRTEHF